MEIKQKQKRPPFSDRRLLCSWYIVCFVRHASKKKNNKQTYKQTNNQIPPPPPKKYLTKVKIPKYQHERALQNNIIVRIMSLSRMCINYVFFELA